MKKDAVSVGTALVLTLIVFAGFINAVMAITDHQEAYSPDGTAYAHAAGAWSVTPPIYYYYDQAHEGSITKGNVIRYAFTEFYGYNDTNGEVYDNPFNLANYTYVYKTYSYSSIYFIRTYTDSGYGTIGQSSVNVEIGPPGSQ